MLKRESAMPTPRPSSKVTPMQPPDDNKMFSYGTWWSFKSCVATSAQPHMHYCISSQSPNPSIERTSSIVLRTLPAAAHVKR